MMKAKAIIDKEIHIQKNSSQSNIKQGQVLNNICSFNKKDGLHGSKFKPPLKTHQIIQAKQISNQQINNSNYSFLIHGDATK